MSFLRTASTASPVVTPQYTGVQVQTASSALPIPIIYGTSRVAPNIIWARNFQAVAQYDQPSGGKGALLNPSSSGSQVSGYTYTTAMLMSLCEGPIAGVPSAFDGQSNLSPGQLNLYTSDGPTPQAPWSFLTARYPLQALGYNGTALAFSPKYDLGSSASIGSLSFEVAGILYSTAPGSFDADPASVVYDFLTSAQYGVGFPAASIDGTALYGTYQPYCRSYGLAFSPALTDQETANSILARWLQLTNATAVWSAGLLKILPYADVTTIVYDLTDDDLVGDSGADPIIVTRSDPYAASNVVVLEALDRSNQYSPTTVQSRDEGSIGQTGLRQGSTITAHEFCSLGVAGTAAQLILQRGLYVRNSYAFRLSWEHCLLEPMDVVTLTDAGLGLAQTPVRIIEIAEDADGLLSVTAEEFTGQISGVLYPSAVAGAVVTSYAPPTMAPFTPPTVDSATSVPIDRSVVPAPVNPPVILEPPSDLTSGAPQLWVGLSGGTSGLADPNWGGAAIFASVDNATYVQVGSTTGPANQGILTAPLGAPPGASSDTLIVNFAESGATIVAGAQPTLIVVDGEIMSFSTATLTATSTYSLGGLKRRLYGQPVGSRSSGPHAVGAQALILDKTVFTYTLALAAIGRPLWFKFASVNVFGRAMQDLSTCTAYPMTPVGSGFFGPIAQAIATGTSLDEGFASTTINESDDFGFASDPYTDGVDEGLASEAAAALALQSGGTGATSPALARQNIGAAAAGVNADITSLGVLTRINGSTSQAVTIDPATAHVGLAGYTADANNALGVLGTACLFTASTDSMRFTFNKMAASYDAALSFQTGFSARALAGLLGSDGFQLKVSPDGSTFYQVYVCDQTTGNAAFKALLAVANYTVATLPAGLNGAFAFATNGRKVGEAAGSGTGVVVAFSNGQWRRLSDDASVSS